MQNRHEKIALRAYALWDEMGRPPAVALETWLEAERLVDADVPPAAEAKPKATKAPRTRKTTKKAA